MVLTFPLFWEEKACCPVPPSRAAGAHLCETPLSKDHTQPRRGGGNASGALVEWQVTNSKVRNTSDPTSIFIFLAELASCACQQIPKPEPIGKKKKKRKQEAMWKIGCAHPGKSWWAARSLESSSLHSAIGRQAWTLENHSRKGPCRPQRPHRFQEEQRAYYSPKEKQNQTQSYEILSYLRRSHPFL